MARKDIINQDGSVKWDVIGGFNEQLDSHTGQLADIAISIKSFGAHSIDEIGYENFDSAPAIRACLEHIRILPNGGNMLIPDGKTFLLGSLDSDNLSILLLKSDIVIKGTGKLKVKNNFGAPFQNIIKVPDTFNYIEIRDITIDENAMNNPLIVLPSVNSDNRVSIWGWSAIAREKMIIDHVTFKDCVGQWQVSVGKMKYLDIINCKVDYSTYVPTVDYDRTSFYHTGLFGNMSFNQLNGQKFSLTAMEIHGNYTVCEHNKVSRYSSGTFIVNDSEQNGVDVVKNIFVKNNVYNEVSSIGVEFWPEMNCDLNNVVVTDNLIYIDPSRGGIDPSPTGYQAKGISVRARWKDFIKMKNIVVTNNIITFKDGFVVGAIELGTGISIVHYDANGVDDTVNVEGFIIENNTINNSYSSGIYISFAKVVSGDGTITGFNLKNNTVINPCSGTSPTAIGSIDPSPSTLSKGCGIYCEIDPVILIGSFIEDNTIIENRGTSLLLYGIYTKLTSTSQADTGLFCMDNNFHIKNNSSFIEVYHSGIVSKVSKIKVITPTLLNGWTNLGAGYPAAGYYKDSNGIVHLVGHLQLAGSTPTTIFNLPVGYRPSTILIFPSIAGGNAIGSLTINSAGNVSRQSGNDNLTLNGISFVPEQ